MSFLKLFKDVKRAYNKGHRIARAIKRLAPKPERASVPQGLYQSGIPIPSRRSFSPQFKAALYRHQNGKCNGCSSRFPIGRMEMDHHLPLAAGGADCESNIQLLCKTCNRTKGARPLSNDDLYHIAWHQ